MSEIVDTYEIDGKIPQLAREQLESLLEYAVELRIQISKMEEAANYDSKRCLHCNRKEHSVILNGGRCNNCM